MYIYILYMFMVYHHISSKFMDLRVYTHPFGQLKILTHTQHYPPALSVGKLWHLQAIES